MSVAVATVVETPATELAGTRTATDRKATLKKRSFLSHESIPRNPVAPLPAEESTRGTRVADATTSRVIPVVCSQIITALWNHRPCTTAGALYRVGILPPHEFRSCCGILLRPGSAIRMFEFSPCSSEILLKPLLQLLKEALFNNTVLRGSILTEDAVRQHTRQRWLGIQ